MTSRSILLLNKRVFCAIALVMTLTRIAGSSGSGTEGILTLTGRGEFFHRFLRISERQRLVRCGRSNYRRPGEAEFECNGVRSYFRTLWALG